MSDAQVLRDVFQAALQDDNSRLRKEGLRACTNLLVNIGAVGKGEKGGKGEGGGEAGGFAFLVACRFVFP